MGYYLYKMGRLVSGRCLKITHKRNFEGTGRLFADGNTKIICAQKSKLLLHASLSLNDNCMRNNGRTTILRLDDESVFEVIGNSSFYYGSDIILFKGAHFSIGNSFINSDCRIRCHNRISIGDGCAISHNVTIMDSDGHYLNGEKHTIPVIIEDHVWVGSGVIITSGVTIGTGAVIAAGAVVTENVAANTLVGGVPAKILRRDINWKL